MGKGVDLGPALQIELDPGREEGETGACQALSALAHKHGFKFLS
jgi:hypothetical protein